ncbi:MAG: oligosaccharide flippase family protein [Anaerolineae bacterium]|nr:oligosaccharide flippase family protein [Anaerolineae bacterium]
MVKRSRFVTNFLALLTSRAAAQLVSVVAGLLLVRLLADAVFGAYSLATTTIGLAGIVADFGLDVLLIREIASKPDRALGLLRTAYILRLIFSTSITLLLVILATTNDLLGRPDLLLIGGLSLIPRGLFRASAAGLTAQGRIKDAAIIEAVAGLSSAFLSFTLVIIVLTLRKNFLFPLPDGAAAALWGMVIGNTCGWWAAIHIQTSSTTSVARRAVSRSELGALLWAAVPFVLVALAGAGFQSLDIYMVKQFHWTDASPDAVALYAAPFRILNVLLLVPTVWGVVALPRYTRFLRKPAALRMLIRRDSFTTLLMGLALSAACTLLAYPLTALGLGVTYLATAPILGLIGWMTLPACMSAPLIALLTATNRQRWIVISVVIAGVGSLIANIVWGYTAVNADVITGLMGVAAIKVGAMVMLLGLYWLRR